MKKASKTIVIVEPDPEDLCVLCKILIREGFETIKKGSLAELTDFLDRSSPLAIILDIDMVGINNRKIRGLTLSYPESNFLGISTRWFHPDMKDAICCHMYACLRKPIDPNEVIYFISSIYTDLLATDK